MSAKVDKGPVENPLPKETASSFVCRYPRCQRKRKINSFDELRAHERTHEMVSCPGCGRYGKQDMLETHFLIKRHIKKQSCYSIEEETLVAYDLYSCDLCDYKSREIGLVVDHYWSHSSSNVATSKSKKKIIPTHEKALPGSAGQSTAKRRAPVCGESITPSSEQPSESPTLMEKRTADQGNRVIFVTCGFNKCTEKFSCIRTFRKHLESHGVKKEVCPICASEFSTQMQLEKHFRIHAKKVGFPSKTHTKGKSAVKNLQYYLCPLCNHSGSWMGTIVKHYWKEHVLPGMPIICTPDVNTEARAENMEFESCAVPNTAEDLEGNENHATIDSVDVTPTERIVVKESEEKETATSPTYSRIPSRNLSSDESRITDQNNCGRKCKETKPSYACPVCPWEFTTKRRLESHFVVHTREVVRKLLLKDGSTAEETDYGCELCHYSCSRLSIVKKHYVYCHLSDSSSSHSKITRMSSVEEKSRWGALERSINSGESYCDPSQESVICSPEPSVQIKTEVENTEFEFVSVPHSEDLVKVEEDLMADPLESTNVESGVKDFVCYSCGYQTNNRRSISRHVQTHTKTRNDFLYKICGFKTDSQVTLRRHTSKSHCPGGLYAKSGKGALVNRMCPLGGFKSFKEPLMRAHVKTCHLVETPEISACETCGAQFDTSEELGYHQNMEKFPFPGGDYVCGVCDYKSIYKCGLEIHKKTHKNKDFECKMCDFIGISAASLMVHKKFEH